MNADEIVRITADCPLIEPWIVDLVITTRAQEKADYASNTLRRTFPRGLDVDYNEGCNKTGTYLEPYGYGCAAKVLKEGKINY